MADSIIEKAFNSHISFRINLLRPQRCKSPLPYYPDFSSSFYQRSINKWKTIFCLASAQPCLPLPITPPSRYLATRASTCIQQISAISSSQKTIKRANYLLVARRTSTPTRCSNISKPTKPSLSVWPNQLLPWRARKEVRSTARRNLWGSSRSDWRT